jgi:hypothetical protein
VYNKYKNIRYFPQAKKFAIMDSEKKEANIQRAPNGELLVFLTLEDALKNNK